jgi:hypothetical protein
VNEVPTDQDAAELQERFVNIGPAFVADGEPAKSVQPRRGAFHDPPVPTQPLAGLNASAGEAALDAALSEVSAAKAGNRKPYPHGVSPVGGEADRTGL